MPTTRVLLSQMPQILREILEHAIVQHGDLELIGQGSGAEHDDRPDVVIVGGGLPSGPDLSRALLTEWPNARVVVLAPAEGDAALYELKPHMTGLGRPSAAELVEFICMHAPGSRP